MKYYKEKFTGNQGGQQVQKKQPEKKQKPKNKSGKKNYDSQQNKKQNIRNVNEKHPVHTENRQPVKNKKKSFFEKVASFFKK